METAGLATEKMVDYPVEKLGDYDYLIQLCDSIAKPEGIVSLEERMEDVKSRYGHYPQEKLDRNRELQAYFDRKAKGCER